MAVWRPFSFAARRRAPAKSGCRRHSPPERVNPPPERPVIGRVFHDFFRDLFHAHITAHGLFLAALNHDLNITDLRLGITAPFAAKGTTLQENDGADARTVMNRIFLDIKDPSLDLSVIITHTFPPQKPWVVRLMMSS